MKTRVLAFVSTSLVFASLAFAQNAKMDVATQDALIQKLEQVLPQINEKSEQATTLRSRLADLYAERARLQDLAAGESECSECTKAARKDRNTAIRFYNSVVNAADLEIVKNVVEKTLPICFCVFVFNVKLEHTVACSVGANQESFEVTCRHFRSVQTVAH